MKKIALYKKRIYFFFYLLFVIFFHFHIFSPNLISQEINQLDKDPFIDPHSANEILNPVKRSESDQAFMLGFGYGLNPIVILAPVLNLAMYWDPIIIGIELSDSDSLGIWSKERKENFGSSRFKANSQFIKYFFGNNFFIMVARENRSVDLWNRTFNRDSANAIYDMFINSKINSLGVGFLRFNRIGFLGIDILRLNFMKNDSVSIIEKWETWTDLTGSRDRLDDNIADRSDKWKNIINSPTGFLITVGIYF